MSIYGPIIEHPEYPIEDERRFTVVIFSHPFQRVSSYRYFNRVQTEAICICGFDLYHRVHKKPYEYEVKNVMMEG